MKAIVDVQIMPAGGHQGMFLPIVTTIERAVDVAVTEVAEKVKNLVAVNNMAPSYVIDSREHTEPSDEVLGLLRYLSMEKLAPIFIHSGLEMPLYVWGGYRILHTPASTNAVVEEAHYHFVPDQALPNIPNAFHRYVHIDVSSEVSGLIDLLKEAKQVWHVCSDKFLVRSK